MTTTIKGLNLTPVQAAIVVYGLSKSIVQLGSSRYRGPLVIRANKTLPPDGQHLADIGYRVEYREDGVVLIKGTSGTPGPKIIELMPGHIVGSAELADVQHLVNTQHEWIFKNAKPTTRRCPACDGKGGRCKVCRGEGKCDPIEISRPVRRAWFQWEGR